MPKFLHAARKWMPGLLLFFTAFTACRKYDRETLELARGSLNDEWYEFKATDEQRLVYVLRGSGTVELAEVRLESREATISGKYEVEDSAGLCRVTVIVKTDNTPGGAHPVRITFINHDESFVERNATVYIVNFAQLLRDTTKNYIVIDTISSRPFNLDSASRIQYAMRVRRLRTDPPNRFIFSTLGQLAGGSTGYIDSVVVDIDSVTGEMHAAGPQVGVNNYRGHGRLSVPQRNGPLRALYTYMFESPGSSGYEGHISF